MEMALQLPNNYVEMEQEEMMYLDGGLTLSASTVRQLGAALAISGSSSIAAASASIKAGATILASKFLAIPILGKIAFGVIVSGVGRSTASLASAFVTALAWNRGMRIGVSLSWAIIPHFSGSVVW